MHYHLAPFLILCNWNSYYLLHKPDDQDETISPHVLVAETIAGPHEVHNQNIRRRTPLGFVLGTTLLALERFGLEEASWNPNDGRHDGSDEGGRLSTETYRPPRDSGDDMNVDDDLSGAGGDAFGGPGRSNQASFYDVTQRSHAITGTPPSSLTTNPTVRPYVSNTLLSSEFGLPSPPSSVPSDSPPRGKVETANTDLPSSAPISSESLFRSPPKMTARSRVARPLAVSPPPLDMELGTPELSPEMTHTVHEVSRPFWRCMKCLGKAISADAYCTLLRVGVGDSSPTFLPQPAHRIIHSKTHGSFFHAV
jgi:hypothetical protein